MWLIRGWVGGWERGGGRSRGFAGGGGDVTAVWLAGDGEEAGCSLPPLYNGAVLIGVGRAAGGLGRKEGGGGERRRSPRGSTVHRLKPRRAAGSSVRLGMGKGHCVPDVEIYVYISLKSRFLFLYNKQ